jgi:hypothetical protein
MATPFLAIERRHLFHRAMREDRPDRRVESGEEPLRLAERVAEQEACAPVGLIRAPPGVDGVEHLALRRPLVDRQAEGRFGDEGVAGHRLERCARRVGLHLVVAGHDPHLAAMLQAYLRRAEDVAGGMQGDPHAVDGADTTVLESLDDRPRAEPSLGNGAP